MGKSTIMRALVLLALGLFSVTALPTNERIVGGSLTTIENYPFGVALLLGSGSRFTQFCAGSILNHRSVLSAAHCFNVRQPSRWRIRVGSTNANSGGVIHNTNRIIIHPSYTASTFNNDISVLRAVNNFVFRASVRTGRFPSSTFVVPDNAAVWAIGWGRTSPNGSFSERLRHVQIRVVNQTVCRNRYAELRRTITANMLCAGRLGVGGRDQCQGDSGGPLIYNGVVVGICSWGHSCGHARYPGVNTRVSRYRSWINNNM